MTVVADPKTAALMVERHVRTESLSLLSVRFHLRINNFHACDWVLSRFRGKGGGENDGSDKGNKGVIFPTIRHHSQDFALINHTFAALSKTESQGLIYGKTAGYQSLQASFLMTTEAVKLAQNNVKCIFRGSRTGAASELFRSWYTLLTLHEVDTPFQSADQLVCLMALVRHVQCAFRTFKSEDLG